MCRKSGRFLKHIECNLNFIQSKKRYGDTAKKRRRKVINWNQNQIKSINNPLRFVYKFIIIPNYTILYHIYICMYIQLIYNYTHTHTHKGTLYTRSTNKHTHPPHTYTYILLIIYIYINNNLNYIMCIYNNNNLPYTYYFCALLAI